jgi:hypothetical protein
MIGSVLEQEPQLGARRARASDAAGNESTSSAGEHCGLLYPKS